MISPNYSIPTFYISSVPEEMSPITALVVAPIGENDPYRNRDAKTDQKSSASPVVVHVITIQIIEINITGLLPYRSVIIPQGMALTIRPKLYTPKIGAE